MKNNMLRIAYFFSFLGIPTYEEGGGQADWAKFPTFTENLFWRLP